MEEIPHRLVMVGQKGWGGVDRNLTRVVQSHDFEEYVFRTEYIPQELMPLVYNLADGVVMPSIVEGFGLPVLEAMACGTPVLISEDPALVETAGDAAIVADATKLSDLRAGLEMLIADRGRRRKLRQDGLQRAEKFTWENAAKATVEVYREAKEAWDKVGGAQSADAQES